MTTEPYGWARSAAHRATAGALAIGRAEEIDAEPTPMSELIAFEAARYLAAVDAFRAEGEEPRWDSEE